MRKKIVIYLLLAFFLCFLYVDSVMACNITESEGVTNVTFSDTKIDGISALEVDDCLDNGNCILMGRYSEPARVNCKSDHVCSNVSVSVLYYPNEKKFEIAWHIYEYQLNGGNNTWTKCVTYKFRTGKQEAGALFITEVGNVNHVNAYNTYASTDASKGFASNYSLNTYAYLDLGDFDTYYNSMCFDTYGTWCDKTASKGAGRAFYNSSRIEINYALNSRVKEWQSRQANDNGKVVTKMEEYISDADAKYKNKNFDVMPDYCVMDSSLDVTFKLKIGDEAEKQISLFPLTDFIGKYYDLYSEYLINYPEFPIVSQIKSNSSEYGDLVSALYFKCVYLSENLYERQLITKEEHDKYVESVNVANITVESEVNAIAEKFSYAFKPNLTVPDNTCKAYIGEDALVYLGKAFNIMKYIAVIILFILTLIDYFKAIASNDKDVLKKVTMTAIKRLIICIIIFLLPILINVFLDLFEISSEGTCGIS